jgi:hypothetical protein
MSIRRYNGNAKNPEENQFTAYSGFPVLSVVNDVEIGFSRQSKGQATVRGEK